jgi:hypothetical protein
LESWYEEQVNNMDFSSPTDQPYTAYHSSNNRDPTSSRVGSYWSFYNSFNTMSDNECDEDVSGEEARESRHLVSLNVG